jgi:tetratricopeptide (TPR) repeat protein
MRVVIFCAVWMQVILLNGCAAQQSAGDAANGSGQLPPVASGSNSAEDTQLRAALSGLRVNAGFIEVIDPPSVDPRAASGAFRDGSRAFSIENSPIKAAGFFRNAIRLDPKNAQYFEAFAKSLMVDGDPAFCEAALRTALRLDPNRDGARFALGAFQQMRGDFGGAVETWKQLVSRTPNYPDAYARMAIAAYFGGDLSASNRYHREATVRKQNVPPQFRELLAKAGNPR